MATIRAWGVILLAVLSLGLSGGEPAMVTSRYFGRVTEVPVRVFKPEGPGPYPAIVWLHDCSGLSVTTLADQWRRRLTGWGYLVALPDSFTPRGRPTGICDDEILIQHSGARVADAFATLRYLQSRPDVIPTRIGMQGHSHGAGVVFDLAQQHNAGLFAEAGRPGFAAAVAYYPFCAGAGSIALATPLLILMGEQDGWTPAELCRSTASAGTQGQPLDLRVYPGALHSFDNEQLAPMTYLGHRIGYDPQAAADSFERTREWFGRYLKDEGSR